MESSDNIIIPEYFKHDKLFKKAMENPLVREEFFRSHLDPKVNALIDYPSLKMEKDSFLEESLKDSYCDLLFSVNFSNKKGYLYLLLEHQSSPDKLMALRLFKYMLSICDRHLVLNKNSQTLPLVYPLIFFNGKQQYNVARNLWALFADEKLAREFWTNDYKLIDVNSIPDEELKKQAWAGTLMFFMKHIWDRNILQIWQEIEDNIPKITQVEFGYSYIRILLAYSLTKIEENDKIAVENLLNSKLGQNQGESLMASLAEKWYHDGEIKGKAEGEYNKAIEIAKKLLSKDNSITGIAYLTGLSIAEIEKLKG